MKPGRDNYQPGLRSEWTIIFSYIFTLHHKSIFENQAKFNNDDITSEPHFRYLWNTESQSESDSESELESGSESESESASKSEYGSESEPESESELESESESEVEFEFESDSE